VVLAGGTSLPAGFVERMQKALTCDQDGNPVKKFPFEVGEVRRSNNPLTSVSNGCLIYAQLESEE